MDGSMTETVIIKPLSTTSVEPPRWTNNELVTAWKKFTGRDTEQPIDQSPNRGSGWMMK